MASNFGQMVARVQAWAREALDKTVVGDAINDAVEELWLAVLMASVGQATGGPVNFTMAAGSERANLVSVVDPTLAPGVTIGQPGGVPTGLPAETIVGCYTLVTASGSETLPSPFVLINHNIDQTGGIFLPFAPDPNEVIGWNVYFAESLLAPAGPIYQYYRLNPTPIPLDGSTFYLTQAVGAPGGKSVYYGMALPAPPLFNTTSDDIACIRRVEVQNPDGTWKEWNPSEITSLLWSYAERTVPSSSTYQSYIWDFLNGRTLEVRPGLGMGYSPRYFYVKKPRRMVYDLSQFPFTSHPYESFVRKRALSDVLLTVHEYDAAAAWDAKASKGMQAILLMVNLSNEGRSSTITPHMM